MTEAEIAKAGSETGRRVEIGVVFRAVRARISQY